MYARGLLVGKTGREAAVAIIAACIGGIDDGVDEIEIVILIYKHIAVNRIENVVLAVGVVLAIVLWVEAESQKLVMNLLPRGEAGILHKPLHQHATDFAVAVLGKANHAIRTIREISIVCLDTLKKRGEVIVGIPEIVEFDDFSTVVRKISLVLRPAVEEVAELTAVAEPAALLLGPFAEPYQLDCLASRCSRKSLNLLKDSVRESGCASQYAIFAIFLAFAFL